MRHQAQKGFRSIFVGIPQNKKARSKLPLKPKAPFKWVFMDIIPSTAPKSLTNDTNFKNYLLNVDAYSKLPKLYGMENITTEEVWTN